jgi:D-glycero-D-manno-heptose 1,7-bisphosphate phosphatase
LRLLGKNYNRKTEIQGNLLLDKYYSFPEIGEGWDGVSLSNKAIFLDRDGVINADRADYVKSVDELIIFDYAGKAIEKFNELGYLVFVISNQQGVAKGLISIESLQEMQKEIEKHVEQAQGKITEFKYCLHMAADNCNCRKPKPGMILEIAEKYNINLSKSFFIGDTPKDITAGKTTGCKTILVLTGHSNKEMLQTMPDKPDIVVENLLEAVSLV